MVTRRNILDSIQQEVSDTLGSSTFANNWAQVRAERLLRSAHSDGQLPAYTYSAARLKRASTAALSGMLRLASERPDVVADLDLPLRRGAEVMEYLSDLPGERRPQTIKLISAALYQLSGFEANAICLARELTPPVGGDRPSGVMDRWTALALQRQFVRLRIETEASIAAAQTSARSGGSEVQTDDEERMSELAVSAIASSAFHYLSLAVLQGRSIESSFWSAAEDLAAVLSVEGRALELLQLRAIEGFARTLFSHGMWNQLANLVNVDPIWHRYVALCARGNAADMVSAQSRIELWESQREAIRAGLLSAEGRGHAVRMPTSSGKTRVAELAAVRALAAESHRKVIYVAPYRALAEEVERAFATVLSDLGFRVSTIMGGLEVDELEARVMGTADLLVTTPEKLALLGRSEPQLFEDVGLLVLDEGHVIDDEDRGVRYELLLTQLKRRMPPDAKILFLSAVIPTDNASEFAEWLCSDAEAVIETDWRPARQLIGIYNADRDRIDYPLEGPVSGASAPFVPGAATPREYVDFTAKLRREKRVPFPTRTKGDVTAELAIRFVDQGPVLVFTTTRPFAESVARAVLRGLTLREQTPSVGVPDAFESLEKGGSSVSIGIAEQWLGTDSPIVELLRKGIGVHHAGLPDAIRRAIEADFRIGALPILVATNTLAQGVNLPVKTVVVHSLTWRTGADEDGVSEQKTTNPRDFWNIVGRAGRATRETEGHIILAAMSDWEARQLTSYIRQETPPIKGRLFELLGRLVEDRISDEELRTTLDPELLALLVEETVGTEAESMFRELIDSSLVTIEAREAGIEIEPLHRKGAQVVAAIREEVPDDGRRAAFAKTGFDVRSCVTLLGRISEKEAVLRDLLTDDVPSTEALVTAILPDIVDLPQMSTSYEFVGDLTQLTLDWIEQLSMPEILERHLDEGARRADELKFHRFVSDLFGMLLPWGFAAYLTIAEHVLDAGETMAPAVRWLPTMLRFGVSTPAASWAMTLGCPARDLSSSLALAYADQAVQATTYEGFVDWFSRLTEEDFILGLGASPYEAEVLVRRASAIVPADREITESLRAGRTEFEVPIVGIIYERRAAHLASALLGQNVVLQRDYGNQYDPNAIEALLGGELVGYVPRNIARLVAPQLDAGRRATAAILSVDRKPSSPSMTLSVRLEGN